MRRRSLLAAGGAALSGLAGCAGLGFGRRSARAPPLPDYRPPAVYVPTHVEGMKLAGRRSAGGYECALTYTFPHRFWLVTGERRQKVGIDPEDAVHLMPVVWDAETGIVPPDLNPRLSVARDGETVAQLSPWPMLSQPMGFHFGDNVALGGDGTYRVRVRIGAPSIRRTGPLAANDGGETFAFDLDFRRSALDDVPYRDVPADREGTRGAVDPMGTAALPGTRAPAVDALPGTVRGTATSGDARFVVTTLPDATPFGGDGDGTYLAVSPRTPYNRYVLPLASLSATLRRDGETVYDGVLRAGLDPDLRHHYGAVVPGVESGDDLAIAVDAPPQVARHEGYETAFLDMDGMALTL